MNKHLFVQFDLDNQRVFKIAGIEIVRPDSWEFIHIMSNNQDYPSLEDEPDKKLTENLNKREVNPQIATVMITDNHLKYKKGDRIFVHYMAKETEEFAEFDDQVYSMISADFVFFKIEGDNIVMADNNYLAEQVYTEAVTPSGIFLTSTGKNKEVLKVKILHAPERIKAEWGEEPQYRKPDIKVGDTVATCDDYQYILQYEGKEYIRLLDREIVLTFV